MWLAALVSLLCACVCAADLPTDAHVLSVAGYWYVSTTPNQPLVQGASLSAGAEIRIAERYDPTDNIVILDADNQVIQKKCDVENCRQPIVLRRPEPDSFVLTVARSVMTLWRRTPTRYASLISRGGKLRDGVLKLQEGSLDLSPSFRNMDKNHYMLGLKHIDESSGLYLPVDWDTAGGMVAAAGLSPGLYRIELLDPYGEDHASLGEEAWVLVSEPGSYEPNSAAFAAAEQGTKRWGRGVQPEIVQSFLRAYLDALSRQGAAQR
jgi:hypothetical protein